MKVKILKEGVTFGKSLLDIGAELEVEDASGKSLVENGYAEVIEAVEPPKEDLTAEEMAKKLDELYKADDLKVAAKEAGVEFDAKATKAEVIEAVIAAEKYADLV